jgi:imidazolonepropionase-like amidohydrolase
VNGKVSAPQNVGVFRGTIVYVGNDSPPPDTAVVDGTGSTLLPGLIDSHAHNSDWGVALDIASGVTMVRDPGNDNEHLLELERKIDAGELLGPRIKPSGFLEGKSPYSARMGFVISTLDEALEKVRWYAAHGYWGLKIYNSMNPEYVKPIAAEAHRLGLHVSGHVPAFMSSQRAIEDGYDEINHINQLLLSLLIDANKDDTRTTFRFTAFGERLGKLDLNSAAFQNLIRLMKQHHTTLDPTMSVHAQSLLARPGQVNPIDAGWLDHAPGIVQRQRRTTKLNIKPEDYPAYDASWKKLEAALVMLFEQGIPLVPGTDSIAGIMLQSELEEWVKAGIPAAGALKAATLGGARFLGLDHELGSIERGKLAYLYLVEGDPTRDIHAIRKGRLVVKGNAVYYPDEIDEALGLTPFVQHAAVLSP